MRRRRALAVVAIVVSGLLVGACSNASNSNSPQVSSSAPGVTRNSILVGSLSTASGPLAGQFGQIVYGVKAYFDAIDAAGGVGGRKIYLKYQADDTGSPTNDTTQARNLVEHDHVFAVVGVGTPFFTGSSFLASDGTPTFGYLVSQDWNDRPSLFGAYGSYLDYAEAEPALVDIAKTLKAKSVAVVAYSIAAQSEDACAAVVNGLQAAGVQVPVDDLQFGLGANPTADVLKMKSAHVDLFVSCMEGSDNLSFMQAMSQNGVNVHSIWLQGYDRSYVQQNPAVMVGAIYLVQHVPFEAANQFPGKYPGMQQYLKTMQKYEPAWVYNELALQGYINAAQFVQGLREEAATRKPLTQARLVAAINKETAFTAGGLTTPVNWTIAHQKVPSILCGSFVEVMPGGILKVTFVQNGSEVFNCINIHGKLLEPPKATPGT